MVLVVIDDTILGLTAVDLYLTYVKTLVGGTDKIVFVVNPYSGVLLGVPQIAAELEPAHQLGEMPWRLPAIPNDPKAALWPGSGRTLYSMGQKSTRVILEQVAEEIGIVDPNKARPSDGSEQGGNGPGWLSKILGRKPLKQQENLSGPRELTSLDPKRS